MLIFETLGLIQLGVAMNGLRLLTIVAMLSAGVAGPVSALSSSALGVLTFASSVSTSTNNGGIEGVKGEVTLQILEQTGGFTVGGIQSQLKLTGTVTNTSDTKSDSNGTTNLVGFLLDVGPFATNPQLAFTGGFESDGKLDTMNEDTSVSPFPEFDIGVCDDTNCLAGKTDGLSNGESSTFHLGFNSINGTMTAQQAIENLFDYLATNNTKNTAATALRFKSVYGDLSDKVFNPALILPPGQTEDVPLPAGIMLVSTGLAGLYGAKRYRDRNAVSA